MHRTILFANQRIDTVQAVTGQNVKAILTVNDDLQQGNSRRLGSALLIDSSQNTNFHNISCSSDVDRAMLSFQTGA